MFAAAMKFNYKIIFSKEGDLRFVSHLDLVRLFTRALRRAELPLYLTCGFNPHPKLSFKRALKVGVESNDEELNIVLNEAMQANEIKKRLDRQMFNGISIKGVTLN